MKTLEEITKIAEDLEKELKEETGRKYVHHVITKYSGGWEIEFKSSKNRLLSYVNVDRDNDNIMVFYDSKLLKV